MNRCTKEETHICASQPLLLSACHPAHQGLIPGDKPVVSSASLDNANCVSEFTGLVVNIQFNYENSLCRERPLFTNLLPSFYLGRHQKQGWHLRQLCHPILLS